MIHDGLAYLFKGCFSTKIDNSYYIVPGKEKIRLFNTWGLCAMSRQRYFLQGSFLKIVLAALIVSFAGGCMFFRQPKRQDTDKSFNEFKQLDTAAIDEAPQLLIADYRDMKEDDTVSWVWVKPGFEIGLCRSFEIAPVINASPFAYPWAEEKIAQWLKKIFTAVLKARGHWMRR